MKRRSKTFSLRHFSWRACIIQFKSWQKIYDKTWTLCYLVFNLFGIRRTSSKTLKFVGLFFFFFVFLPHHSQYISSWLVLFLSMTPYLWNVFSSTLPTPFLSLTLNIASNLSSTDTFTMVSHMCIFLTSYVYLHLIPSSVIWTYSLASFAFTIFCFTLLVIKIPSPLIQY